MKNIHAGLLNCLGKSMKNSSSGLSLCLREGGDHRILVETQTPEGTRSDATRGVWNSLCLVNSLPSSHHSLARRLPMCGFALSHSSPEAVPLLLFYFLTFLIVIYLVITSNCFALPSPLVWLLRRSSKHWIPNPRGWGQRNTGLSHSLVSPELKILVLFLNHSW